MKDSPHLLLAKKRYKKLRNQVKIKEERYSKLLKKALALT